MDELILKKYAYKKKKPVLLPFARDIQILLEHDATQKSVLEYLENEKGIKVSQAYLSKFIKQYIYGDKKTNKVYKNIEEKSAEATQEDNNSKKTKDTSNSKLTKAENELIEEWLQNNQNILQKPTKTISKETK